MADLLSLFIALNHYLAMGIGNLITILAAHNKQCIFNMLRFLEKFRVMLKIIVLNGLVWYYGIAFTKWSCL